MRLLIRCVTQIHFSYLVMLVDIAPSVTEHAIDALFGEVVCLKISTPQCRRPEPAVLMCELAFDSLGVKKAITQWSVHGVCFDMSEYVSFVVKGNDGTLAQCVWPLPAPIHLLVFPVQICVAKCKRSGDATIWQCAISVWLLFEVFT